MASIKLTELFTDIADALREKGGTTEKIKAVDFADAIENLPSGGGDFPYDFDYGEFEVSEDTIIIDGTTSFSPYTIEHSLGKIPFIFRLWIIDDEGTYKSVGTLNNAEWIKEEEYSRNTPHYYCYNGTLYRINADVGRYATTNIGSTFVNEEPTEESSGYVIATDSKIILGNQLVSNAYQFILRSGYTYRWFALSKED